MLFGRDSTAVIKRQAILIKFVVIYLFLITLAMIPAWITAMRIEKKIQVYFSSIFYSLEKPSRSIAELEKVIVSYNKIKFIENKQDDNKNSFAYLTQNEEIQKEKALKIALLGGKPPNKIEISKVSALDSQFRIAISTTPKTILDNILPKHFNLFYSFTIKNSLNPLSMVMPKSIFIIFLTLLSGLLTLLWASIQSCVFYKKEVKDKAQELEKHQRIKTAHLNFMENALNDIYEDLNHLFLITNFEKELKPFLESKILEIRQSIGRIITFGTLKRDYYEIELIHELNSTIDCFLDQITDKKITIIKNNFSNKVLVQQTKAKNFLILTSIFHHFIINMPPKGELTIAIELLNPFLTKVIFSDNVPIHWKIFEQEKDSINHYCLKAKV